ncbi:hypothetical protein AMECASPLE_017230 [Ameca splendens]|uniref:Uncharacterized protein n=1 Tax=Ameca splendens TaxID=208324 RepID=A0ABV0ZB74_9TELE
MWVKSALKTMTKHSGQPDPAETLLRTVSEHGQLIQAHGSTLRSLLDQQQQVSQQLEQMTALMQRSRTVRPTPPPGGAVDPPVTQQLLHSREATSHSPEKFSGEVGSCRGFLLQSTLVFNRSTQSFPP